VQIPRLREWRERRALTQVELAEKAGVSERSVAGYEAGSGARPPTVRKLAEALDVEVTDLYGGSEHPLGAATPSAEQQSFNHLLEEERLAEWRSAVADARRLREGGRARMAELLAAWRSSKERQEDASERRGYLDDMGELLNKASDTESALMHSFPAEMTPEARRAAEEGGGRWMPNADWEEVSEAARFYGELIGMIRNVGFRVEERGSGPPTVEEADAA
jgi:transcriptional regulator with XRE-family HTH domain